LAVAEDVEVLTYGFRAGAVATDDTASSLAEVLAEIVGVERVSADSHFFDELGADSLVMAHFCARVRKRADLPSVSMKDIYRNPTIRSLAAAVGDAAPVPAEPPAPPPVESTARTSTTGYVLCGAVQALFFVGYAYLTAMILAAGFDWMSTGSGWIDARLRPLLSQAPRPLAEGYARISVGSDVLEIYLRSALFGGALFVILCVLPIVAKWVLVGRWKPGEIRLWSLGYLRFWIVKTLVRTDPLVLFVGSPLYPLYLRALGAKIGREVAIFTRSVPICTDLFSVGDRGVIRKDSLIGCYRARAGRIELGPVTLGKDVVVGEKTVLDIDSSMGDGAQLGHSSALHAGQAVPDGERWHGSPARPAGVDYRGVQPARCTTLRRVTFCLVSLLELVLLYLPLPLGGGVFLLVKVPKLAALLDAGSVALRTAAFYRDALLFSVALFVGSVVFGLLWVLTVPRLLNLFITPDKVYPLYGIHYRLHRAIARMTNARFFTRLFGDSSAIVGYLRWLGYDLSRVEQTGSNFGTEVVQETPYLAAVGSGTMVADGLSIINADFSSTSFRVSKASIGAHNFLGNRIGYPAQGRTGENCLLATKVMVPIDGPIREGVGLLGSPCFEIPRSVERDSRFDELKSPAELRRGLAAKNRHNAASAGLYLLSRWAFLFGITLLGLAAVDLYRPVGAAAIAAFDVVGMLFSVGYYVLLDRFVTLVHPVGPLYCSIYDVGFWRRERYWKVPAESYLNAFNGTPFKSVIWRLLGARIGRRVFDDGCYLAERPLATIGDDCVLNAGSAIQCHSQEDGAFKSDGSALGAAVTVGVGALVHYGVTMGDGSVLAADSFLMKGEQVPARAAWGGNPATEAGRMPSARPTPVPLRRSAPPRSAPPRSAPPPSAPPRSAPPPSTPPRSAPPSSTPPRSAPPPSATALAEFVGRLTESGAGIPSIAMAIDAVSSMQEPPPRA
jgi:non-ribosomal peptide synthetase-like protein